MLFKLEVTGYCYTKDLGMLNKLHSRNGGDRNMEPGVRSCKNFRSFVLLILITILLMSAHFFTSLNSSARVTSPPSGERMVTSSAKLVKMVVGRFEMEVSNHYAEKGGTH